MIQNKQCRLPSNPNILSILDFGKIKCSFGISGHYLFGQNRDWKIIFCVGGVNDFNTSNIRGVSG